MEKEVEEEESLTLIKPFLYSLPRKQQRRPKKEAQGRREERFVCESRSRAIDRVFEINKRVDCKEEGGGGGREERGGGRREEEEEEEV